jgi:guanylate kinase
MSSLHPRIVALTAPSGTGKTTIARRVLQAFPQMRFSVSATTRPPRDYETDGVHYHFLTPEAFEQRIEAGDLIEYEEVYPGKVYGTLRSEVERATNDAPVLLDIEVNGAYNVKRFFGDDALVIFIRPPSMEALAERLRGRATEDPHSLQHRLRRAEMELQQAGRFDAIVVNDDLEDAVAETIQRVADFLDAEPVEA